MMRKVSKFIFVGKSIFFNILGVEINSKNIVLFRCLVWCFLYCIFKKYFFV